MCVIHTVYTMQQQQPKLYTDLASWFHLLTAPSSYAEAASYAALVIQEAATIPIKTVLELGSGGGNNASHLKARFQMTLSDLSPAMLDLSHTINPEGAGGSTGRLACQADPRGASASPFNPRNPV